jgi:hypothetical protein
MGQGVGDRNVIPNTTEDALRPDISLEFLIDGTILFESTGTWLHPLFELERFLKERKIDARGSEIHDKVVGRGGAFLIVRLGARTVHAGIMSRLGKDVLDRGGVACTWDRLIDEIECKTEGILREVMDPEEAYALLAERARKAKTRPSAP